MIKNILSMIIGGFILFIGVYMIFMLGNEKFSFDSGTPGANKDITGTNLNLLGLLTFLLIFGFIILMVLFGNNLINLNLRYSEQFVGGDKEEFLSSISCSKKLKEDKLFCSKEYKDSLFSDLVAIDKKIDYLKKEFKKIKKSGKA
tara:strand:- start:796 stop:1230 length:435 start_codon:yes stop_codon:yes gene_type:complete